jgi:hypothetical protein
MPNPWLNEHKSKAAMNYFLILTLIIAYDFDLGMLQGALETFSGIGMMAGPAVGGALYTVSHNDVET